MNHLEIISKMSLLEKASLLSGESVFETRALSQYKIPSMFLSDGPHGIRKQMGSADHLGLNESLAATCFPTSATVANSWDTKLAREIGEALGEECRLLGVDVLLGPGLNIKRSPLCGRNFEYFSEDPYLSGKIAAAYINGIQSRGVAGCPKHFAVNSQELRRISNNSVLDERTLREIYLTAFEIVVKESSPRAIMSAYNEVNGVYAHENAYLLKDILRDDWGFNGFVVSDWGGSNNAVLAVSGGGSLEMPCLGYESARLIVEAVENGMLSERDLDSRVDEIVTAALYTQEGKEPQRTETEIFESSHKLAEKAARESIVLLKNKDNILPISKEKKVAIIGDFAETPRYQGSGSSVVRPTKLDSTLGALPTKPINFVGYSKGYNRSGEEDSQLIKGAVELAETADIILLYMGLDEMSESEGLDRADMKINNNQVVLIKEIYKVNSNIIVVLSAGSPIEMEWEQYAKGILHGYLSGQAGAGGMLDAVTGEYCPSGKLNESYPMVYEDCPSYAYYPGEERSSEYREGLFVGYRYYETVGKAVRYHFGYGLSYTDFAYSDLKIRDSGVSFAVTNTGSFDGAEIAQLYINKEESNIFRPSLELKGFTKIFLRIGEAKEVTIPFDQFSFRYFNTATKNWEIEKGSYNLLIGASSRDIRLKGTVLQEGTETLQPYTKAQLPNYFSGDITAVSDEEFSRLLEAPIPDGKWSGEIGVNDSISQLYYAKSWLARRVYGFYNRSLRKANRKGKPNLNLLFQFNMPFRAIAKMTNGMVSMHMIGGITKVVNGHFFKGMRQVISGFFQNKKANKKTQQDIYFKQ